MNPKNFADKTFIAFSLCLSAALITLAIIRAYTIPLTHDEAVSYSNYVSKPVFDIIGYVETYGMPNNHILNTLMMKASAGVFGDSTLALRLPNLLGFVIYLYFSFRLLFRFRSKWLRPAGLLLLCCNPYLFDFFTLARGYGIANGLIMAAVFLLYSWQSSPSTKKAVVLFLFAGLAVIADFVAIHFYVAIAATYIFIAIRKLKTVSFRNVLHSIRIPGAATLILGGILYEPFRCIMKWKTTFGGSTGSWHDSIVPLTGGMAYTASYYEQFITSVLYIVIALLVIFPAVAGIQLTRKTITFQPVMLGLLLFPAFFIFLQHTIFGTEFPVARTMQFFFPLFILTLLFSLDTFQRGTPVAVTIAWLFAGMLAIHFSAMANTTFALEWKYDASDRKVLDDIAQQLPATNTKTIKLGITWIFEPGLNYERKYRNISWLSPLTHDGIGGNYDYYYVTRDDTAQLARRGMRIIFSYPTSNSYLMK